MYRELTTVDELDQFMQQEGKKLLFKHSTQCPISAAAFEEFQAYLKENGSIPAALVKVIESRPVSNEIAERLNIKHESPQIFLLDGDKVLWHTSHWNIKKEAIREQVG